MNDYCVLEEIIYYLNKYESEYTEKVVFIGTLEECLKYEYKIEDINKNARYYVVSCMGYKKECNEFLKDS